MKTLIVLSLLLSFSVCFPEPNGVFKKVSTEDMLRSHLFQRCYSELVSHIEANTNFGSDFELVNVYSLFNNDGVYYKVVVSKEVNHNKQLFIWPLWSGRYFSARLDLQIGELVHLQGVSSNDNFDMYLERHIEEISRQITEKKKEIYKYSYSKYEVYDAQELPEYLVAKVVYKGLRVNGVVFVDLYFSRNGEDYVLEKMVIN